MCCCSSASCAHPNPPSPAATPTRLQPRAPAGRRGSREGHGQGNNPHVSLPPIYFVQAFFLFSRCVGRTAGGAGAAQATAAPQRSQAAPALTRPMPSPPAEPGPAEGEPLSPAVTAPPALTLVFQAGEELQLLLLVGAVHPAPPPPPTSGCPAPLRSAPPSAASPGSGRAAAAGAPGRGGRGERPGPLCTCPDSRGAPVSMCEGAGTAAPQPAGRHRHPPGSGDPSPGMAAEGRSGC